MDLSHYKFIILTDFIKKKNNKENKAILGKVRDHPAGNG